MNKDRVEGSIRQAKGSVKSAAGKMVGDSKLEAEGKADKAVGKVQNTIGGIKDSLRKGRRTKNSLSLWSASSTVGSKAAHNLSRRRTQPTTSAGLCRRSTRQFVPGGSRWQPAKGGFHVFREAWR
jgi:uncharacterized protein YjbJ (UPF0337 family)